jgi:hypothetical protein
LKIGNDHQHQDVGNVPTNGVWFINKATKKYTSNLNTNGTGDDDLRWTGAANMNKFSPQIRMWRSPSFDLTTNIGPGIYEANKKMSIGFGPICASTTALGFSHQLWDTDSDYIG